MYNTIYKNVASIRKMWPKKNAKN